jgi:ferric-dicitrate binding protein FerR (iron transport regulator)
LLIPNTDRAVIEPAKLHDYLLSRTHPIGRFKAAFFQALGYSSEAWRQLEADLRSQHLPKEAAAEEATSYGRKFVIRATLVGPSGASAALVSVWVVRAGEDFARFVTAYPEGGG